MASFGETLKRERELRDISLRQIAEATKISIRYLEALEQNRFNVLPGGLFNKGFIRAYSAYIGLDGEAMVNSYLQQLTTPQAGTETVAAARTDPGLHRPTMVPQRRAGSTPEPPPSPAPAPPPAPRFRPENQIEALRAALNGTHARPRASRDTRAEADPAGGGSRALLWIVSAAAGVAVVFLVLSLFGRPVPSTVPSAAPTRAASAEAGSIPAAATTGTAPVAEASSAPAMTAPAGGTRAGLPKGTSREESGTGALLAGTTLGSMPAAERTPPAVQPAARSGRDDETRDAAAPAMDLEVTASERTWVTVLCDGREELNRVLQAGETASLRCLSQIRVSVRDAGMVHLSVNGSDCLPLGESGAPAYGYTIRRDDYRQICPSAKREAHGR